MTVYFTPNVVYFHFLYEKLKFPRIITDTIDVFQQMMKNSLINGHFYMFTISVAINLINDGHFAPRSFL